MYDFYWAVLKSSQSVSGLTNQPGKNCMVGLAEMLSEQSIIYLGTTKNQLHCHTGSALIESRAAT